MSTSATTTRKRPAFLVNRGDVIRYERRTYRVGHVQLVARYARNRNAGRIDPVLTFTLWPTKGSRSRQVTLEQPTLVSVVS